MAKDNLNPDVIRTIKRETLALTRQADQLESSGRNPADMIRNIGQGCPPEEVFIEEPQELDKLDAHLTTLAELIQIMKSRIRVIRAVKGQAPQPADQEAVSPSTKQATGPHASDRIASQIVAKVLRNK